MYNEYEKAFVDVMYSKKLASVVANENIKITFDTNATTACFSPKTRVITLPANTLLLDIDINDLLVMHEVSHALHTSGDILEKIHNKVDHSLFNIVLDIRDERLIKEKYNGCYASFARAYKKLLDMEFFGNPEHLRFASFANRLNVYAKCGEYVLRYFDFSDSEYNFYNRCMKANNVEDIIKLTNQLEEIGKQTFYLPEQLDEYLSFLRGADGDNYDIDSWVDDVSESTQEDFMKKMETMDTYEKFLDKVRENNIGLTSFISYVSIPDNISKEHIIPYNVLKDVVVNKIKPNPEDGVFKYGKTDFSQMRRDITKSIDSMVTIFESKKSAEQYKNIKISKTGDINMNRVYRYKFDNKIFSTKTILQNQKNHGYLILLDFSGSMGVYIQDVMCQVINLIEFFRKTDVKYSAYTFGGSIDGVFDNNLSHYDSPFFVGGVEYLFEIFNEKQTNSEYKYAAETIVKKIRLRGTPTTASMMYLESIIPRFFSNVSRKNMIIFTDGDPSDTPYEMRCRNHTIYDNRTNKIYSSRSLNSFGIIDTIAKIYEDRYDVKTTIVNISYGLKFNNFDVGEKFGDRKNNYKYAYTKNKNLVYSVCPSEVKTDFVINDPASMTTKGVTKVFQNAFKNIYQNRPFLNAIAETLS